MHTASAQHNKATRTLKLQKEVFDLPLPMILIPTAQAELHNRILASNSASFKTRESNKSSNEN